MLGKRERVREGGRESKRGWVRGGESWLREGGEKIEGERGGGK